MATFYGNTNSVEGYVEALYNSYTPGYEHVLQEQIDVYMGKVRVDTIEGENKAYDFLGTIDLKEKQARFEDIPIDEMTHNRRWVYPRWFRKGILVDKEDDIMLHTDPASDYIEGLAKGIIRKRNDVIHGCFFANVKGGKAPGDHTYSFNNAVFSASSQGGRTIPHDCADESFAAGGTSSGLTLNKLQMATRALNELHNNPNGPKYIGVTDKHLNDLVFSAKMQSVDTSPFQALALGTIPNMSWGGWTFVKDYNITLGTNNDIDGDTNVYELPVWVPEGIMYVQHESPMFQVANLVRKGPHVFMIAALCGMNAFRRDEDRVLKIETI